MSENYRYYAEKIAELRGGRADEAALQNELEELFEVVRWCEAMWALEDRIERG